MKSGTRNWIDVWESKGEIYSEGTLELADLLKFNGYDSGSDAISLSSWNNWLLNIFTELPELEKANTWMDVGCGAGAFLFSLPPQIGKIGCDYSQSLISVAKTFARQNQIECSMYKQDMTDSNISFPNVDVFSLVSSLQYIEEYEAIELVNEIFQAANIGVLIAETPNLNFFEEASRHRDKTLLYKPSAELKHTYYSPEIFDKLASAHSYQAQEVRSKLGKQSNYRWSRYYKKIQEF